MARKPNECSCCGHATTESAHRDDKGDIICSLCLRSGRTKVQCDYLACGEKREWLVRRQDEHGNRFTVRFGMSQAEAGELMASLEPKGHKQTYTVERQDW